MLQVFVQENMAHYFSPAKAALVVYNRFVHLWASRATSPIHTVRSASCATWVLLLQCTSASPPCCLHPPAPQHIVLCYMSPTPPHTLGAQVPLNASEAGSFNLMGLAALPHNTPLPGVRTGSGGCRWSPKIPAAIRTMRRTAPEWRLTPWGPHVPCGLQVGQPWHTT